MSNAAVIPQLSPLFGRKYQVQVLLPDQSVQLTIADSSWDLNALRVTFDMFMPAIQAYYWDATIAIYNADQAVVDQLLSEQAQNMFVRVSAGYQNGNYDVIWEGPVFQAFLERENVVDTKLTLYCIIFLPPLADAGNVGQTYSAQQTQTDIVRAIAKLAQVKVATISEKINPNPLPRAKTVFGNISNHLTQLAEDNGMQWWLSSKGLNFGNAKEDAAVSSGDPIVFSPPINIANAGPQPVGQSGTGSIIGTPQETMYAVAFRVLLDPRIKTEKPLMTVKIDNSQLRFLKRQIGQFIVPLDQDGIYVVGAVRHTGDTRGNTWYTEIQGMKRIGNTLALYTAEAALANINNGGTSR